MPVAGVDVSGGDFRNNLKFTKAVLDGAPGLIDIYTGHPYASPRYFGPGKRPLFPEDNAIDKKCKMPLDALAEKW